MPQHMVYMWFNPLQANHKGRHHAHSLHQPRGFRFRAQVIRTLKSAALTPMVVQAMLLVSRALTTPPGGGSLPMALEIT